MQDWMCFDVDFRESGSRQIFLAGARSLKLAIRKGPLETQWARDRLQRLAVEWPVDDRQRLRCALEVLADLLVMGLEVSVGRTTVQFRTQSDIDRSPADDKAHLRQMELTRRDEQLDEESVRRFVQSMERSRRHNGRFVSIFNLMRDGAALVRALDETILSGTGPSDLELIRPYVQVVETSKRCDHTGLRLMDIWRYFRHTWSNQYQSVPGRSLLILVRDSAAEFHPIIGLAALSSPVVGLRNRDQWIGWDPDVLMPALGGKPVRSLANWLRRVLTSLLDSVFIEDLIALGLLSPQEVRRPSRVVVARLRSFASEERERHHQFGSRRELKGSGGKELPQDFWRDRAQTYLFRSKRAALLADLLEVRTVLMEFLDRPRAAERDRLLGSSQGRRAVRMLIRRIKADRIGSVIADISVCGALPPYSHLLGGKLVAMLATSPTVLDAYKDRYAASPSEIASAMAARPVVRPSNLVALTTTSLYGVGSSQYNRVVIPGQVLGGPTPGIRFERLGRSETYGTSQFSERTVKCLVELAQQSKGGQRVNSIFGEGASPRLRKIRTGLDLLGLPSNQLLRHGRPRLIYGIALVANARDYLLGFDRSPRYLMERRDSAAVTQQIVDWWTERWLRPRVESPSVRQAVARHSLTHPIRHGARVPLRSQGLPVEPLSLQESFAL